MYQGSADLHCWQVHGKGGPSTTGDGIQDMSTRMNRASVGVRGV